MKIQSLKYLNLKYIFLFSAIIFNVDAWAGHFVGNGGDYIRGTFIRSGQSVIDYLMQTTTGAEIVSKNQLSLSLLEASLDINKIEVVSEELIDNTGSIVDAIGVPDLIKLNSMAWFNHFENERDIYYLIFHEMLRSVGVNDDNYIISKTVFPFPLKYRQSTSVVSKIPLIADDNLSSIFDISKVNIAGSGCSGFNETHVEFDSEKNILSIQPSSFIVQKNTVYKSCQLAIPIHVPQGSQLVISQIDIYGKLNQDSTHSLSVSFESFLTGSRMPRKNKTFQKPTSNVGRFLIRRTEVLRTKCGVGSDILRLNASANYSTVSSVGSSLINQASMVNYRLKEDVKDNFLQVQGISLYLSIDSCK